MSPRVVFVITILVVLLLLFLVGPILGRPVFIAALAVIVYVGGPVLVRFTQKQPAHPELAPVELQGLPAQVSEFFQRTAENLAAEGFTPAARLAYAQRNVAFVVELHLNRPAGDAAAAIAAYERTTDAARLKTSYVEFATECADGSALDTNNSSVHIVLPQRPGKRLLQLPDVQDVSLLYKVHRAALEEFTAAKKGRLPAPGEERSDLAASMIKELVAAADAGYMYLDETSDVYRPTWKGAFLMTWKSIWPGSAIVKARMRRKVAPILSQVTATEPR